MIIMNFFQFWHIYEGDQDWDDDTNALWNLVRRKIGSATYSEQFLEMVIVKPLILGGRMFGTLAGLGHAPSAAGCDQNCFENYQKMQRSLTSFTVRILSIRIILHCIFLYKWSCPVLREGGTKQLLTFDGHGPT